MQIEVTQDFLDHRAVKHDQYNQRGRSERKFLMDLDAELLEHYMISEGYWNDHNDWKVDAVTTRGNIDVKFLGANSNSYTCNSLKLHNMLLQRNILDGYLFMRWGQRPNRPLEVGDIVTVEPAGFAEYDRVADGMRANKDGNGTYYFHTRMVLAADRDVSDLFHQVPTYRV